MSRPTADYTTALGRARAAVEERMTWCSGTDAGMTAPCSACARNTLAIERLIALARADVGSRPVDDSEQSGGEIIVSYDRWMELHRIEQQFKRPLGVPK